MTDRIIVQKLTKRLLAFCLVLLCLLALPSLAWADVQQNDIIGKDSIKHQGLTIGQAPDVDAGYGMLATSDGKLLWARSKDEQSKIASVTKIMTAVVAIEHTEPNDSFTIPKEAIEVGESSANLVEGSSATIENLLKGLLIESGNDAAVTLAIGIAGSESAFADMMNEKAAEIGMTNTVYRNPHGLDEDNYAGDHHSSASDLITLSKYAMQMQEFRDVVCLSETTANFGNGDVTITSTNNLLTELPGCIGIKTGFTDEAGYCLASAAKRSDIELYAVVLGASSAQARFDASENLLEWGFDHYVSLSLCDTTTTIANIPASSWMDKTVPVSCTSIQTAKLFSFDGPIEQEVKATKTNGSIKIGAVIGSITWKQNGAVVGTAQLAATQDCPGPGFFEGIGIWFKRTFTDAPDTAELEVLASPPSFS